MNTIANESPELEINPSVIKNGIKVYKAVNSQFRQKMLDLMHQKGRMTVTELFTELDIDQPVASNHLAILRNADLVIAKRIGKHVFYSINYPRLEFLHLKANDLLDYNTSAS